MSPVGREVELLDTLRDEKGKVVCLDRAPVKHIVNTGKCLGFSTMYDELTHGVGQYPVMLVELPDGFVCWWVLEYVRFKTEMETPCTQE